MKTHLSLLLKIKLLFITLCLNATDPEPSPEHISFFDAAQKCDAHALEELLQKGFPVDQVDNRNRNALHWCAFSGSVHSLEVLLKYKANPNVRDGSYKTPLHWAARENHDKCIKTLLRAKANLHETTRAGITALHEAAIGQARRSIKALLEEGIDPNQQTHVFKTALDLAKEHKDKKTHRLLKRYPHELAKQEKEKTRREILRKSKNSVIKNFLLLRIAQKKVDKEENSPKVLMLESKTLEVVYEE